MTKVWKFALKFYVREEADVPLVLQPQINVFY